RDAPGDARCRGALPRTPPPTVADCLATPHVRGALRAGQRERAPRAARGRRVGRRGREGREPQQAVPDRLARGPAAAPRPRGPFYPSPRPADRDGGGSPRPRGRRPEGAPAPPPPAPPREPPGP